MQPYRTPRADIRSIRCHFSRRRLAGASEAEYAAPHSIISFIADARLDAAATRLPPPTRIEKFSAAREPPCALLAIAPLRSAPAISRQLLFSLALGRLMY